MPPHTPPASQPNIHNLISTISVDRERETRFREDVLRALDRLEFGVEKASEHLLRLDATIERHAIEIRASTEFRTAQEASAITNERWRQKLTPAFWFVCCMLVALILNKGPELAGFIAGKGFHP